MADITYGIRIDGHGWRSQGLEDKLRESSQRGLAIGAEYLLEVANRTVPLLEGHLERSGEAKAHGDNATVSYDIVYARYQHEGIDFVHTMPGRRAKWLELAMAENHQDIMTIIANEVRRALE